VSEVCQENRETYTQNGEYFEEKNDSIVYIVPLESMRKNQDWLEFIQVICFNENKLISIQADDKCKRFLQNFRWDLSDGEDWDFVKFLKEKNVI